MKYVLFIITLFVFNIWSLSQDEAKKIGLQIWKNESSMRKDLLVFWSEHESFPSLGIGHYIWFPKGLNAPYTEQFPLLCNYLKKNGVILPAWLEVAKNTGAPWKSRLEFLNDKIKTDQLRSLLSKTIGLQTNFMIERLHYKWPLIVQKLPRKKLTIAKKNFELLRSSLLGNYALIDYLNFKGDGLNPNEEINGCRWGLAQVIFNMPDKLNVENAPKAFTISATKLLLQLIEHSAPEYTRLKYLNGWIKRISTYCDTKTFDKI